ncbi:hypothetical protein L7F22_013775 [Adiantum nelumboides]|nr:hypothetical protein [Adiantum nelumboides]
MDETLFEVEDDDKSSYCMMDKANPLQQLLEQFEKAPFLERRLRKQELLEFMAAIKAPHTPSSITATRPLVRNSPNFTKYDVKIDHGAVNQFIHEFVAHFPLAKIKDPHDKHAKVMGPHEQLRYLANGKGVDYVLSWRLTDDQRSVELTGCCCSGTIIQNELETSFSPPEPFMEGPKCPDIAIAHSKTRVCEYLIQMPLAIPLESGLHGQVLFTGQPQWINMTNSDACTVNEISQAKVYVPMPTGLLELGLSNQALDNPPVLQSVMDKCGEIWMGSNTVSMVVNVPESPPITGFAREMQTLQGMIEDSSMKKYQTSLSVWGGNGDPRAMYSAANSQLPWTPSVDLGAWGHETPLNESHLSLPLGSQQLHYPPQAGQSSSFTNQKQRSDLYEGIGDSLHQDRTMLPADQNFADIILPMTNYPHQKAPFIDSPRASGLSKEVSDKDVKQEMRAESSDCSDQMEDDEEKGAARTGRRHLSKNLVAERKRRKKLNERLYSLRALVPKITKASFF